MSAQTLNAFSQAITPLPQTESMPEFMRKLGQLTGQDVVECGSLLLVPTDCGNFKRALAFLKKFPSKFRVEPEHTEKCYQPAVSEVHSKEILGTKIKFSGFISRTYVAVEARPKESKKPWRRTQCYLLKGVLDVQGSNYNNDDLIFVVQRRHRRS